MPSPLEGWGLKELLDRLPPEGAVVVFEMDRDLREACRLSWENYLGQRAHHPRLFYLDADSEESVQHLFRRLPLSGLRRCELLTLGGSWLAHAARYRQIFARLEQGLTRWWSNRMTSLYLGPLWIRNLFDNLADHVALGAPWPDWGHDTVLVCGAGVTLEAALPWALAHRSQLRLVAADTSLAVLKAWDLVPDAVVCLEAQHANLRDFSGWSDAPVPLFTDLTSYPPGSRVLAPPTRWFISEFSPLALWERWPWKSEVPIVPPLGSVGVAAAWLAWRLSRGQVILAGLDFSYPPGKTHARGAPALSRVLAQTNRFAPVEQLGTWIRPGVRPAATGPWLTSPVMEGYAGVLADQARPHAARTWVWSNQGLPLELPVWTDRELPARSSSSVSSTPALDPSVWLGGEQTRWVGALACLEKLNQAASEEGWFDLERRLSELDYLTFPFPDPEFRRDYDWLARVQAQLRWLLDRVSRRRRS